MHGRKTGGRVKGTPIWHTASIKEMILNALDAAGGEKYLTRCALENPAPFLALLGRVLPHQLAGEEGRPLAIDFRWADGAPPAESPTLEPEVLASAGGFVLNFASAADAEPS